MSIIIVSVAFPIIRKWSLIDVFFLLGLLAVVVLPVLASLITRNFAMVIMGLFVGAGLAIVLAVAGLLYAQATYHEHIAVCTVTAKDLGADKGGYRVYTRQCGTLANHDSILRGKFNSADVQGELGLGHTYRLRVVGWRFEITSDIPNILDVEDQVS